MRKEPEVIIKEIQEITKEFNQFKETAHELEVKQEEVIRKLIEKYTSVYKWIVEESDFYFTHPTLSYKSNNGPILGYVKEEDRLILFDPIKESIRITDIGEKYKADRTISISYLIRRGHFSTALEGLSYLEEMFNDYTNSMAERVSQLNEELSKAEE